jgi:apolipoprotein N-acyltransferase
LLAGLAHRVILSEGWTRYLIALGAGAIGALSMPPFGVFPALAVAMTLAVWLLDGAAHGLSRISWATTRSAAAIGWWFGFGYFVASLWWLGAAFLVEPDAFAWALPLGVLGLPAGLALFTALGFALARLIWSSGAARVLALAGGLGVSEWLRGVVLTGFPWNEFGMALAQNLYLAQIASVVGLYGLNLLAVAIAAAPATIATGVRPGERWGAPVAALAALAGLAAFGALRLSAGETALVPGVKLRIMQPNLPQDSKFRPENRDEIMRRYLTISDRATSPERSGVVDITHLIWPESAFPFVLARDQTALAQIAALLPPGAQLITGAVRASDPLPGENTRRYFNAIQVIGDDGVVLDSADKVHLVPFGEYLPLSGLLSRLGLRQFVHVPGAFEPGTRLKALQVAGLPIVAPLICYEAIFPDAVIPEGERPGLLLNVTNDAWFGQTPGPHQHFAQARLRSIEQGLPLVRAANSGISAVIDPYGRIVGLLPLGVDGVLDTGLPSSIHETVYASYGGALALVLFILIVGVSGRAARLH